MNRQTIEDTDRSRREDRSSLSRDSKRDRSLLSRTHQGQKAAG